eukprot:g12765.t1
MVTEVSGEADFRRQIGVKGKLVVVDFTASWCGPCKMVAPKYEQLASQHPDVLFLKVVEDSNKELIISLGIRAFPTFRFYIEGNQVDETRGANINEVASKVVQHKANVQPAFAGEGMSLGGGSGGGAAAPLTGAEAAAEARARRLARFGAMESTGDGAKPDPEVAKRNAKILATASRLDVPPAASSSSAPMDVDPPAAPAGGAAALGGGSKPRRAADPALVSQLMEMGFAEIRAKKGLMFGNGNDMENAVNWLMEHQEDADIDEPIPEGDNKAAAAAMDVDSGAAAGAGGGGGAAAQSLKCDQCQSTLKDVTAAELHAHKTGHSDFSESTDVIKPLTPEEKAAKLARMKELIAARRAARGEEEKVDHVKREKARRTMGKEALKTKEEMQAIARKNAAARIKKEKADFERERARLKEEIARDKAERKARGGKLSTKLGVDGYKPAAAQGVYGGPSAGGGGGDATPAAASAPEAQKPAEKQETSEEKMTKAVDILARQTVAGLGGTAMKTCLAYIKNALTKPEEEKFRSINLDNNAYKNRVATCIGGTSLLKAVGFAKEEGRLFMSMEARDEALLTNAKEKLEAAIASYSVTSWPTGVAATCPYSTTSARRIGKTKDIGAGLKEEEIRPGERSQVHFRATPNKHPLGLTSRKDISSSNKEKEWSMPHGIWSEEEVNNIQVTHKEPEEAVDHIAFRGVRALRWTFDVLAGFKTGVVDEHKYLNRVIFLETVAGIPGMVAGTLRHLTSLRRMRRDHGWIHTLLEEAENERMHLLTFLKLKKPGPVFRFAVMISQGVMYNAFFLSYLISPKACHRFVGYIEEEAVHTYTKLLEDIDANKLPLFSNLPAPAIAKSYWKLGENAMFRDLILAVRADEANHRVVNHTFADMHQEFKENAVNPFSIHASVTKYSDVGVTPPSVADIANGHDVGEESPASSQKQQEGSKA